MRDIEDAFEDESGRLLPWRTAVSEIGEGLWTDCQEFGTRDLAEYDIAFSFIDGIAERIRPEHRREPVLAACCFTSGGANVMPHLMVGSREGAETVSAFFQDMRSRGLGDSLPAVRTAPVDRLPTFGGADHGAEHELQDRDFTEGVGDDLEAPASVLALTRDSRAVSLTEQPSSPRPLALLNNIIVLFAATPVVAPISILALILIARIEETLLVLLP